MESLVGVVFLVVLIVVAFFVLRSAGLRYFPEQQQADVAALAVAGALAAGLVLPSPVRSGPPPQENRAGGVAESPAPIAADPAGGTARAVGREVTDRCKTVSGAPGGKVQGNMDSLVSDAAGTAVAEDGDFVRADAYTVRGWAVDPVGRIPVAFVCLVVDGRIERRAQAFYGASRPDVVAALGQSEVETSGYLLRIPRGLLSAGRHRVEAAAAAADGALKLVAGGRDVVVR
jgi:hypothetical protein